jgi:hypothetical protein
VRVARFRFIEAQAHLWERHQRLCAFVADVKGRLGEERWTEKERATGQAWVTCAENYLASRDPTALLFFNPLLAEDGPLFSNYRYTMPAWGPPADTWLATWEPRVPAHTDTRDALALQLAATPKLPLPPPPYLPVPRQFGREAPEQGALLGRSRPDRSTTAREGDGRPPQLSRASTAVVKR